MYHIKKKRLIIFHIDSYSTEDSNGEAITEGDPQVTPWGGAEEAPEVTPAKFEIAYTTPKRRFDDTRRGGHRFAMVGDGEWALCLHKAHTPQLQQKTFTSAPRLRK